MELTPYLLRSQSNEIYLVLKEDGWNLNDFEWEITLCRPKKRNTNYKFNYFGEVIINMKGDTPIGN